MNELIYLDNAATTRLNSEALEAMLPYMREYYVNSLGIYGAAAENRKAIEKSRKQIAGVLDVNPDEISFTSGGTESDNWALIGMAESLKEKGNHIITSKIEHRAILNTCMHLEKRGFDVTYLEVDENGKVDLDQLKHAIRPTTILISIMFANNEIGTIQPIHEIGKIAREYQVIFHTDAVQAFAHIPIPVNEMNIDILSASGHKFNGPKGIGFLYVRNCIELSPLMHGGKQEQSKRGGTHNVPGIVGMGKAAEVAAKNMVKRIEKEERLRDYLINQIITRIPFSKLNGDRIDRLPNNVNFSFQFTEGEAILLQLDQKGICASSGSACATGSKKPSHVLTAIGLPQNIAFGSLRLTVSEENSLKELDFVVTCLEKAVERSQKMSPLFYKNTINEINKKLNLNSSVIDTVANPADK